MAATPASGATPPAPGALTYSAPIPLALSSTIVKSRVRNLTTNEWSPLTEARFALATVPASASNTVISEIMYSPPPLTTAEAAAGYTDPEAFEYIVLQNIGPAPIDLSALRFQFGITFGFDTTTRPVIDPGQRTLLAKNASALRFRYGAGIDPLLGGEYFGSLKNEGELLRLEVAANSTPIKVFTFDDLPPWPAAANGRGSALLLLNPATNPDHDLSTSWTASAALGGTPTGTPLNLTYPQWAAWAFSTTELASPNTTSTGDFDQDGIPNLIEALTGSDPRNPSTPSPLQWAILPGPAGGHLLRLTFPRLTGLTAYQLHAQSSPDLITWQNDFTLTASAPAPNGATLQTWEKTTPAPSRSYYLRLRASPLP